VFDDELNRIANANPMWNQTVFAEKNYGADELDRFPKGAGFPGKAISRIAATFRKWREIEKYSRIVAREKVAGNDFNISPSRYIHIGAGE
jgi:type I restriction-modification system DNA methylase subunit